MPALTPPCLPAAIHRIRASGQRQGQVVALVAQALPNKEIAVAMCLKEDTIKQYLKRIQAKLGLRNRTALATWTLQRDLSCPLTIP